MIKVKLIVILLFFCVAMSVSAAEKKMLLVGGGLKICSSYATKNCSEDLSFDDSAYQSTYFQVTDESIKLIEKNQYNVFSTQQKHSDLVALLQKYLKRNKSKSLSRRELLKKLDVLKLTKSQRSGRDILDSLHTDEWNFVFHHLQLPVTDSHGNALTEYVFLDKSHPDSQAIIHRFVDMVQSIKQQEKPLILVSTASANDVFDAASFYMQLFKGFDVEVAWLPIEASLNRVLTDDGVSCEQLNEYRGKHFAMFNREKTYPQLAAYQQKFCKKNVYFEQLVNRASGIFFNGGDQFLTLSALADTRKGAKKFSSLFKLLQKRFNAGKLVVAGTSAGTAVHSGGKFESNNLPMITNGESIPGFFTGSKATDFPPSELCEVKRSCGDGVRANSLTTFKPGGLEFLPIGLLDTHFSERDRAFRLIRLLADNQVSTGFGVDENTALQVIEKDDQLSLEAVGEGAVWRFDMSDVEEVANGSIKGISVVGMFNTDSNRTIAERLGGDLVSTLIKQSLKHKNSVQTDEIKSDQQKAEVSIRAAESQNTVQLTIDIEPVD